MSAIHLLDLITATGSVLLSWVFLGLLFIGVGLGVQRLFAVRTVNAEHCLVGFWLGFCLVIPVASKIWPVDGAASWKLHRISGAYLIIMIPAHLLFMHLQPGVGHDAEVVINRMQNISIKFLDIALLVAVQYHAGYGLISISKDYIRSRILQPGFSFLVIFVMALFGWMGIKLTLTL